MEKRIKLAYVCPWFDTKFKGPLFSLLNELSNYMDIVCVCSQQKYIQYYKRNEKNKEKIEWVNPHFKIHRFNSIAPRDIIIPFNIKKILNEEKPDIIQSDEFFRFTTIQAGNWAIKNNIPLIINSRMRYRKGILRNKIIGLFKKLSKNQVNYSSKIIATQGIESEKEFLRWFPDTKNKFIIIPNSISLDRFGKIKKGDIENFKKKYQTPKDKKVILDVGRVYPVKRIDLLIRSFSEIKKQVDCILMIVGPSEEKERKKIDNLIKELNLEKDIIFTGPINNDELGKVYASSDIFVNTSETEGICFSFLEAMTFKLPIVAFDVGSNKEVIGKENVFEFGDIKKMSKRIIDILKDKKIYEKESKNNYKKLLNEYDLKKTSKKLIREYKDLIK